MRKHLNKPSRSPKRFHPLSLTTLFVVLAILAVGAATVASKHKLSNAVLSDTTATSPQDSVTLSESGQAIYFDNQLGQTRQLTTEEAERLAAGLGPMVNQSSEGLVEVRHPDGSVSLSLEGHFQNVTVARATENGGVSQGCVDSPQSAGAFFGIDPKLIENRPVALERNEDR